MRDRLIDILLKDCITFTDSYKVQARLQAERVADLLLANGVIVQANGHWIETQREWDFDPFYYIDYQCSVCGMREQDKSPFCRWCGTQMKEERSNENAE